MKKEHSQVEESKKAETSAPTETASPTETVAAGPESKPTANFNIMRVYVKDVSFESPSAPAIFREKWEPKVSLDLNTANAKLEQDLYDVVLKLTVTVKNGEKTAFLCEVATAGIFLLQGMAEDQLRYMLSSFCPNILFPYAREAISDVIVRGGFPPLYLAPINFDVLLEQQAKK